MGLFTFTQELAIDLGTANTLIMHNGKVVVAALTSLPPIQPSSFPWEQELKDLQQLKVKAHS